MERYTAYDNFTWLYNKEWTQFARNIFPLLKVIVGDNLHDGAKVLDLCCGTGQLAKVLIKKGYKVTGIDGSANQIKYARKNAPGARFIVADARAFKIPTVYNVVFSTFDSLNHILKAKELWQTFKNVYKCLVSGGIFVYDLNTERTFEKGWKTAKEIKETPEYFYAHHGDYNKENKIAQYHITIFQHKAKGWKKSDVILYETFFPNAEVKAALKKVGFTDIQTHSFGGRFERLKTTKNAFRIFYYARKP